MHRVLTILAATLVGFGFGVFAANAGGAWRALEVKGQVRTGTISVANGTELNGDITIETSANSAVTLVRGATRFVVGANARVRLPADGDKVDVLQGSAVIHRAGSMVSETVQTGASVALSPSPLASRGVESHAALASDGDVSQPARQRQTVATAARPATISPTASYAPDAPTIRPAFQDHAMASGLGSAGGGALQSTSLRSSGAAAPALRVSTADDIDLPSSASGSGRLQLDSDVTGGSGPHRTMEQQVGSAATAFAEANHQAIVPINRQAAEQLLHRVKPNSDSDHEEDGAHEVVNKAAGVMAAVIVLQLLAMGLLALWRFTRQPKSPQTQPRWRSL